MRRTVALDEEFLATLLSKIGLDMQDLGPKPMEKLRPETTEVNGIIYSVGDTSRHLYLIAEDASGETGVVEILFEHEAGTGHSLVERAVDGVFGEMEFTARDHNDRIPERMFTARSLSRITLLAIPYQRLLTLDPCYLGAVDRRLATRAVQRFRAHVLATRRARATSKSVNLAESILLLAEDAGIPEGGGRRITIRKTQQQLADEVGLTREVANGLLNRWVRAGLISLEQGAITVRDYDRLRSLIQTQRSRSRDVHNRTLARIDALLVRGDAFRARNIALESLRSFPGSSELQQRAVLAALRSGATDEARALLSQFKFDSLEDADDLRSRIAAGLRTPFHEIGERAEGSKAEPEDAEDSSAVEARVNQRLMPLFEDILALQPRLLKSQAWTRASGETISEAKLRLARNAYEKAYAITNRPYVGINAASLSLMTGEMDKGERLARQVLSSVGAKRTFWDLATRGEALAILGRWDDAARTYTEATNAKDASSANRASARLQLHRLEWFLGAPARQLLQRLPQVGVVAFSGQMMRAVELDAKQQRKACDDLVPQILDRIQRHQLGIAYGALATGPDILFAQEVIEAKRDFCAVLPFRVEDFVQLSVRPGYVEGGPDWRSQFASCLSGAISLDVVSHERMSGIAKSEVDDFIRISNRRAVGLAMLKADELITEPVILVVSDGRVPETSASTGQLVRECRAAGVTVDVITCPWSSTVSVPPASSQDRGVGTHPHAAVLFVWIEAEEDQERVTKKTASRIKELLALAEKYAKKAWGQEVAVHHRILRSASVCIFRVFGTCTDAIDAAKAFMAVVRSGKPIFRCICDYGPVIKAVGSLSLERLGQLEAADEHAGLPDDTILATEAFAAEARFEIGRDVMYHRVGKLHAASNDGMRLPTPSLPFYRVLPT